MLGSTRTHRAAYMAPCVLQIQNVNMYVDEVVTHDMRFFPPSRKHVVVLRVLRLQVIAVRRCCAFGRVEMLSGVGLRKPKPPDAPSLTVCSDR